MYIYIYIYIRTYTYMIYIYICIYALRSTQDGVALVMMKTSTTYMLCHIILYHIISQYMTSTYSMLRCSISQCMSTIIVSAIVIISSSSSIIVGEDASGSSRELEELPRGLLDGLQGYTVKYFKLRISKFGVWVKQILT